jgi:hypothetical protein
VLGGSTGSCVGSAHALASPSRAMIGVRTMTNAYLRCH